MWQFASLVALDRLLSSFLLMGSSMFRSLFVLLGACVAVSAGAESAKEIPGEGDPAKTKVTYEDDVKPIFREHCMTCHNQGDKRGGFALDSYGVLMEGGGSGEVVYDDGDPDGSRLWQLVNHDDTPVMPPEQPKISEKKLAVIRAWIEGGALENSGSKAKAKAKNPLAFAATTTGKPDGPPPMPKSLPQTVPVVTSRSAAITAVAASPWAPLVAIAGQKQIVLYHGETGKLLGILPFPEGIAQSLRFSGDGRYLVAGGGEHSVRGIAAVYAIETGERLATVGDDLDTVFDADCSNKLDRVALGGPQKMLRIFDATDGTLLFDLKKHTDWIYAVAFSPDGVLVASADRSGGVVVWEADTGRQFLDLTDHKGAVNSLSWRDDSNVLASASDDGTVKLWDMVAGKAVKSISVGSPVTSVRFDHKGQLVTGSKNKKTQVWDASGKRLHEISGAKESVLEVAITHDSSRVVIGDWSGSVVMKPIADLASGISLRANPAPVKERLKAFDQVLAGMRSQLAPVIQKRDKAKRVVDTAKKLFAKSDRELKVSRTEREQVKKTLASLTQSMSKQEAELLPIVKQSQDLFNKITKSRQSLANQKPAEAGSAKGLEDLAEAEVSLADVLTRIAKARRDVVKTSELMAESNRKLRALDKQVASLEGACKKQIERRDAAQKQWDEANAAHQKIASQLSDQEREKAELVAAVQ